MRSGWKLPFINNIFLSNLFFKSSNFITSMRSCTILPHFIGKKIRIYSGRTWKSLIVNKFMVGMKLGEFSISKIFGSAISFSMALKAQRKKEDKKKKKK